MASYIVMEPAGRPPGSASAQAVFVRDGFAFFAFLVPVIWFLVYRMWIEALAVLAIGFALAGLGSYPTFSVVAPVLSLFVSIFAGLEANGLRVEMLRRRGWRMAGVVEAGDRDEAEVRYYADEIDDEPEPRRRVPEPARAVGSQQARPTPAGPSFGLIDYPGAR